MAVYIRTFRVSRQYWPYLSWLAPQPANNGGEFDAHQRAIDPTLVRGGLGFDAQLLVV